ncbi:hypothetical protein [Rhizobium sp. BK251]|uniref:hypothetical protein n=1 Tax=Rhizobium sp. BK251 TaxID=2512125 RepID=UPI00104CC89B|nr:hypothetical protein [Rhizobium sp. BK251]TCL67248.1 hypothetical protein EV286_110151 [Rhizobium sp. BK251]
MRKLPHATVLIACLLASASYSEAFAALENDTDYISPLPRPDVDYAEYTGSTTDSDLAECHPDYAPAFVRAPDGTIVGVEYLEISSGC